MKIFDNLKISLSVVAILWIVFFVNMFLPVDLQAYGIRPRQTDFIWGILFAPFLHGNYYHIAANSGSLFVLLLVSLSYHRHRTLYAVLIITLLGGGFVWLFGTTNTVHIGASGIIFGLIGFLMFIGIFRREWKALIVSIVICFGYGGALFSLLVYVPGISWSGHFFGFLTGVISAWLMRTSNKKKG